MYLYRRKSTRIALLPVFLGIAATLLLTACGGSAPTLSGSTNTPSSVSTTAISTTSTNTTSSTMQFNPLQAIRMVDTSKGWALTTKNAVLKTSDGGHHWQDVTPKAPVPGGNVQGE